MPLLLLQTFFVEESLKRSYEGCFRENPNDREFNVAGGDLSYDQAEPHLCTALCKSMDFAHAALQEGYLCLCSDSVGKHSNGSQSGCIYRCSGDQVSFCGGPGFGTVYSTATAIKDFAISDPGYLEVFQPSDILITLGDGTEGSFYAFDFGDTTGVTATMPEPQPHIYVQVNVYLVLTWVWNTDSGPLEARREVFVEAPISDLSTTCDPFVEVDHPFTCFSNVGQGTSLEATWNFNDDTNTATMDVAVYYQLISDILCSNFFNKDAQRFIIGDFVQRNITSVEPAYDFRGVYIIPYLEIEQDGKLEAWEVYAVSEGQILLQVFRPLCKPGEKYCTFNRTCINRYWPCPPDTERICQNDTAFCVNKGSCQPFTEDHIYHESEVLLNNSCTYKNQSFGNISTSSNLTRISNITSNLTVSAGNSSENSSYGCNQTTTHIWYNYSYTFGDCIDTGPDDSSNIISYKLVGSKIVYLMEGYNIFTVQDTERISLKPHDVLGFTTYQQKFPDYYPKAAYPLIGKIAHSSDALKRFFFVEKPLLVQQDEYYTDTFQIYYGSFYLRAHMSKMTRTWIQHSFSKSGMFTVDVEFNNRLGNVIKAPSRRVASQYRILSIEGLDFTRNLGIYYACTDALYPMKVEITQGTFARFRWFFPNGTEILSAPYLTTDIVDKPNAKIPDSQSYHFDEIGNYTILVKSYNNISSQHVTLLTIARYRILGLNGSIELYPNDNTTQDWNLVLAGCWFNFSSAITSGNVVQYIWDYGDGQGSGDWKLETMYSHYYESPGTYTVSIRSDNIASILDHSFKVTAEKPNYVEIPDYGTSDIPVLMFCRVTWHSGEGLEFHWDFGDDSTAVVFDTGVMYHNYTTYGVYPVTCTIKNYPLVKDTKSIIVQDPVEGVVLYNKTEVLATSDDIDYVVTWTRGNDVKFDWFYGDQFGDTTQRSDTKHVYNMANYYSVQVNVSNVVSWMLSKHVPVEVQERVTNTQVACDDNMVHRVVEVTVSTDTGNKIWYTYDFGDGNGINVTNSSTVVHIYIVPGIFTVAVTAYNGVSSVVGTTSVQIDTIIEATYMHVVTPHVRAQSLDCKCTAIKGSSVLITFDWGDGSADGPFKGNFDGMDSDYTSSHTYATEGTFNITCFIENPWGNSVNSRSVVVQEAIVELEFTPTVSVKGNIFNFTLLPFAGDSHDVLLEWDYGDGLRYTTTQFQHQYIYRDAGKYDVTLTATNLVSKLSVTQELYTQEHVVGLTLLHDVMPVTPGNLTIISWAIEYGTDVEFKINLGDGVEDDFLQIEVGNSYSMYYRYQQPGSYNITVTASNRLNGYTVSTMAHVEHPIDGLAAYIQGNSSIHTDRSALIKITIEQGTNVEYTCDYHDGSAPIVTTRLFCKHKFIELGPHVVTVFATNHLSVSVVSANETYMVFLPPIPQMIQDLGIHSDDAVIVGTPMFFYLEKSSGNMFNCTWDFGDGSTYVIDRTMYYEPVIHTYDTVNEYDVLLNCSNYVYPPVEVYKHIHVQEPITGLAYNVTPVIEYGQDFLVNFTIETGTDVSSDILYAGLVFSAYINGINGFSVIPSVAINQSGWVDLTITADNRVTEKLFLTKQLYVQNRMTGLEFWADPPYVTVGSIVTCFVSLETGTNVTFQWHFGTNYVVETHLNESSGSLSDSRSHFYSQVGFYAMHVIASNHFNEFTSTPILIAVQNKIHGFSISTKDSKVEYPNGTIIIDMQWNKYFKTLPTNATLAIDFGDGSEIYSTALDGIPYISTLRKTSIDCSDASLPNFELQCQVDESSATENTKEEILSIKHNYIPGIYTVTGTVYNLASEQVVTLTVQTQEPLEGCDIVTYYVDRRGNEIRGGGPANNYFPIKHPVVLSANHTHGTGLRYGWRFGDGGVLFTNDLYTPHKYNTAKSYSVRLYSRNIFGSIECTTDIFIQKAVVGLFLAHSGPTPEYQPITVVVFVAQAGTSATYILDVPNEINMTYYLETPLSDQNSIEEALEIIDDNLFLPFDPFTHAVTTLNLTFNSTNNYKIDVFGFNFASSSFATTYLPITKEPCQLPKVIILGGSKNFSNPLTIRKSFSIILFSDISVFCQKTISVTINWSVYVLEFFNREPLPIDDLSRYPLPNDVLLDQAQLILPKAVLDYGGYIIQLTVTMDNQAHVSNSNHTYLEVVPSKLVAKLSGGHFVTLSRNESLVLNASLSYDPDAINITRSSDAIAEGLGTNLPWDQELGISWSCRLLNEISSGNGCYREGHDGLVQGILVQTIPMNSLIQTDFYIFSINVTKEGRKSATFEQKVTLINGNIPTMEIICIQNCKYKTSPSHRLVVKAVCQNCGNNTENIHYNWYMPLSGTVSGNITDSDSKYFVVPPSTLLTQTEVSLLVFLSANRDDLYVAGRADYEVNVGSLPQSGTCDIIPTSGISFDTSFSISCNGYTTQELPLSYSFFYNHGPADTLTSLYTLIYHSPESNTPLFTLPAGEGDGDIVQILIKVTDALGSFVEDTLQVQVTAPIPEVVESKLLALTSDQSTTLLDELIAKGDTQKSVKYIGDLAVMLNQVSRQDHGTWDSQINQQVRSKLVDDVDNIVLQTVESLQQTSSVLQQIINEPEELSFQTQVKSSEKYTDMLSILETDLSDQLNEESVFAISTNFFEGASNLLKAANRRSDDYYNNLSNDQQAWDEYFADTNAVVKENKKDIPSMLGMTKALLADDVKAAAEKDKENEPIPEQLQKSRNITRKMLAFVDGVSSLILKHKVPGEEAVLLQSDHMSLLLKREDLHSLGLRFYMNPDGSWFKVSRDMLSEIHTKYGDELMVQVMTTPQNPYTWHASGYEVRTSIVSLTMKNPQGENLVISDLSSNLEMLIPRGESSAIEFETLSTVPNELLFVNFNITEMYSSIHIDIVPTDSTTQFTAYLRFGFRPTTRLYDLRIEMPLPSHNLYESKFNSTANVTTNPFTWYIAENELFSFGSYYLAIRPKPVQRDKYAVLSVNDSYADDPRKKVDFDIKVYNARCLFWSETYEQWFPHGCEVGTLTTPSFTHCLCNHLTAYGGSFFVAEKKQIYHVEETIIIVVVEESQLIYYILGGVMGFFLLLLIVALRLDRQIENKVSTSISYLYQLISEFHISSIIGLLHNKMFGDLQSGPYNYLVTFFTGNEIDAGTTSEIYVKMSSRSVRKTALYHLCNPENLFFKQGNVDAFLMSTPKPLSNITSLTVCLDGRGYTPSWHLSHACIQDCWTGVRYFIFCNCWMSKNSHPKTFKVATYKELAGKMHLFDTNEIHHGFWSYWRTIGSSLTLAEIVVSWLVSVMMIISCCVVFHEFLGWEIEVDIPFTFSTSSLMYGLQAGLLSIPVRLALMQLFSSIRPRLASFLVEEDQVPTSSSKEILQSALNINQNANPQESPDAVTGGGDKHSFIEFVSKASLKEEKENKLQESSNQYARVEDVKSISNILNGMNSSDNDGMSSNSESMGDLDSGVMSESEGYQIMQEPSDFARRFHEFFLTNSSPSFRGTVKDLGYNEFNYNNNAKNDPATGSKRRGKQKFIKNKNDEEKSQKVKSEETPRIQRRERFPKNLWKRKQMSHAALEQKRMLIDRPSCVTILLEKLVRFVHKRSLPWFVAICLWILSLIIVAGLGFFIMYFCLPYPDIILMNLTVALISAVLINIIRLPIWVFTAVLGSIFWKRLSITNTKYIFPPLTKERNLKAFKRFHKSKHSSTDSRVYGSMNYRPNATEKRMRNFWMVVRVVGRSVSRALVLLLVFSSNDSSAYYMKKATETMFVSGYETNSISFLKVTKGDDFFRWANETFHPSASIVINSIESYDHLRFLGSPRFRQFRVQRSLSDSCRKMNITKMVHSLCAVTFSSEAEDRTEHFASWSEDATSGSQAPGYNYISPEESSGGVTYYGKYASYSSAGYTAELGPTSGRVLAIIENLHQSKWIDQFTRAVFVEFAVINVYTGLICLVTLVMEVTPGGNGESFADYAVLSYSTPAMQQYILIALAGLTVILLMSILREMKQKGRAFYDRLSNIGNLIFVCLSLATIYTSYMYSESLKALSFAEVNVAALQELVNKKQLADALATLLLMLTTVHFLDFMRYIPRLNQLRNLLKAVLKKVLRAQPIYIMMMALFVVLGKVLYGSVLEPFSSWVQGLQLLLRVLLGGPREGTPDNWTLPYFLIVAVMMIRLSILLVFVTLIIQTYSSKKIRLAFEGFVENGVISEVVRRIQRTYNTKETLEKVRFRKKLVARKWRLWRNQQDLTKSVLNKSKRMARKTNNIMAGVMSEHKALFNDPAALVDEAIRQKSQINSKAET
ncbi:polycystin-1-like [Antedon mediterranea]|uniref:polycystin-1-like n=1 Tax=Antedon mediterranea TaxID=105859 RepID=UPI003AF61BAC